LWDKKDNYRESEKRCRKAGESRKIQEGWQLWHWGKVSKGTKYVSVKKLTKVMFLATHSKIMIIIPIQLIILISSYQINDIIKTLEYP